MRRSFARKKERTKKPLNGWEGKPHEKDARSGSPVPNQSSKVEQVKLPAIFYAMKSHPPSLSNPSSSRERPGAPHLARFSRDVGFRKRWLDSPRRPEKTPDRSRTGAPRSRSVRGPKKKGRSPITVFHRWNSHQELGGCEGISEAVERASAESHISRKTSEMWGTRVRGWDTKRRRSSSPGPPTPSSWSGQGLNGDQKMSIMLSGFFKLEFVGRTTRGVNQALQVPRTQVRVRTGSRW